MFSFLRWLKYLLHLEKFVVNTLRDFIFFSAYNMIYSKSFRFRYCVLVHTLQWCIKVVCGVFTFQKLGLERIFSITVFFEDNFWPLMNLVPGFSELTTVLELFFRMPWLKISIIFLVFGITIRYHYSASRSNETRPMANTTAATLMNRLPISRYDI